MGDGDGEPTGIGEPELSAEDKSRKGVLLNVLHDLGVNDLPDKMVDQLTVLGRPQLHKRNNGASEQEQEDFDVPFKNTHLGDELAQIAAFDANEAEIADAVFQGQESLEVIFDGDKYEITRQSFKQDHKYMVLGSDVGKAGDGPETREAVAGLYNDLNMGKEHMDWMRANPQALKQLCLKNGIEADSDTMRNYEEAFNGGFFMDIPLAVAVDVSIIVASQNSETKDLAPRLEITPDKQKKLEEIGLNPRTITTRRFFDDHLRLGQTLVDSLGLEKTPEGKRMLMLFHVGLTHHDPDYMPESFENKRLVLVGKAENLPAFQAIEDKINAAVHRSGKRGESVREKVFDIIKKGRMLIGKGEAEAKGVLERFNNIGDSLNWHKFESAMREGYKVAKQRVADEVNKDITVSGTSLPVTSTGAA